MKRWTSLALVAAGCVGAPETEPDPSVCTEGVARSALSPVDRKIIGSAAAYPADGTLRARDAQLASSMRQRREVAWKTLEKILAPVDLSETLPNEGLVSAVPLFQTFYDRDELKRIFHRLYSDLSAPAKEGRDRFTVERLDEAFAWNVTAVDELPTWPVERYLEYLAAIDEQSEVAGLGGIARVGYSPAAARHLLQSYPEVLACADGSVPPADAKGPVETVDVARTPVDAPACEERTVGSYAIERDETIRAVLEGTSDAVLSLHADGHTCTAEAGEPCEIEGPAEVEIRVRAGVDDISSIVDVKRQSDEPPWSACLDGAMPLASAIVKADFRRADFDMTLPTYETGADALAARFSSDASWEVGDGEADPDPQVIHTLKLPNGASYRLAGLHVMTKELDHWLWITMWWSPTPEEDFGEDRPNGIVQLGGAWKNYKMCVVTAFEEGDPAAGGGFDATHPSLAAALAAANAGPGGPTWCSNPYLEEGHGNASSSCIGCHQHGGTSLTSEQILLMPARGRTALRNNFPTDYSWAVTAGDDLGQMFADEEAYWQPAP